MIGWVVDSGGSDPWAWARRSEVGSQLSIGKNIGIAMMDTKDRFMRNDDPEEKGRRGREGRGSSEVLRFWLRVAALLARGVEGAGRTACRWFLSSIVIASLALAKVRRAFPAPEGF